MPRTAADYSPGLTGASKSALLELMTCLRSYSDALVLVGGWAPYFILERHKREDNPFEHIGSIDIDLAVNPAIVDEGAYATIVELIEERGYTPGRDGDGNVIPFRFERNIQFHADAYTISVDFLSTQSEIFEGRARRHIKVQRDLRARTMRGCQVALEHNFQYELMGTLPGGANISLPLKVADVVGCVITKAIALGERHKEKDAYDIYSIVANYEEGPGDVAEEIAPFVEDVLITEGLEIIRRSFRDRTSVGPNWVADFLMSSSREERERIITDAYMNVNEMLRVLDESHDFLGGSR